jgi:hypothetical protein
VLAHDLKTTNDPEQTFDGLSKEHSNATWLAGKGPEETMVDIRYATHDARLVMNTKL